MTLDHNSETTFQWLAPEVEHGLTAVAAITQKASFVTPAFDTSTLTVLQVVLANVMNLQLVQQHTTDDFSFVSLSYFTPEVERVLPSASKSKGAAALVQAFKDVSRYWTVDEFKIEGNFENPNGAAIFGSFTYTSNTLGKTITSPFAVLARGKNGKLSYVQFMEDTYAAVRNFRGSGKCRDKVDPDGIEHDIWRAFLPSLLDRC